MKRMNAAIWMSPSVKVGRIAWRSRAPSSPSRPYSLRPDGGSRRKNSEKSRISMIPSQKLGNDTPKSETAEPTVSQMVLRRTAASTPERDRHRQREGEGAAGELEGRPEPVEDQRGHGIAGLERAPEVAPDRRPRPARVLEGQRPVEAEPLADPGGCLLGELPADEDGLGPAGREPHQREEDQGDADQHEDGEPEPLDDVAGELATQVRGTPVLRGEGA